jgi:hypothetical protein
MEKEDELSVKIHEELFKQFHIKTRVYNLEDDSFRYELFDENGKINLWQVDYTNDESGLHIDWGNALIVTSKFL